MATDRFHLFTEDGAHVGSYGTSLGARRAIARSHDCHVRDVHLEPDPNDPTTLLVWARGEYVPYILQPAGHPDIEIMSVPRGWRRRHHG